MTELLRAFSRRPTSLYALRRLACRPRGASWQLLAAAVGLLVITGGSASAADDGNWVIESFAAEITVRSDATVQVVERIAVEFGAQKHGIYREIPVTYKNSEGQRRSLEIDVESATDGAGRDVRFATSREGANLQIRLGDPRRTVTGRQEYVLTYGVRGALNTFADHHELYWNVTGAEWPVPMVSATARVAVPRGALRDIRCFEGRAGSTEACDGRQLDSSSASFAAKGRLQPGEQLTVVVAIQKDLLTEPVPIVSSAPRTLAEYFEAGPWAGIGALAVFLVGALALGRVWWSQGRDKRFTSLYYLTQREDQETRPVGSRDQIVVEYQPPEGLRPAEIGLLLDERADTKDVTATIIHLAVRGYLTIAEIPEPGGLAGLLTKQDWMLTKKRQDTAELAEYERIAFEGMFADGDQVKLAELKQEYYATLSVVADELCASATERGWFRGNPESTRNKWLAAGLGVTVAGAALAAALGRFAGLGLLGLPVAAIGLALVPLSRAMASRSALGSELLRRSLGFREYMVTAETDRQRFFEQASIFSEYLPYAIVFGCVERWARAFEGIEAATAATAGWYVGGNYGSALAFSGALNGLNSTVSNVIASTPAASGSSGFGGGGFSGGGFGGGGGGSW